MIENPLSSFDHLECPRNLVTRMWSPEWVGYEWAPVDESLGKSDRKQGGWIHLNSTPGGKDRTNPNLLGIKP